MNDKRIRKKIVSGILVATMVCSSIVTNGFDTVVHKMVKAEVEEELEENQYYIYFECEGGVVSINKMVVTNGTRYGVLPTPSRIGFYFFGWYTEPIDGEKITMETVINLTDNQTLYARWEARSYNVNFDANGGIIDIENKTVAFGDEYGILPTPQKENEVFLGWYTQKKEGTLITSKSEMNTAANHTLYAHWGAGEKQVDFEKISYSFANTYETFVDSDSYQMPLELYRYIWGDTVFAKKMYDQTEAVGSDEWEGKSFGMAVVATLLYMRDSDLSVEDFNREAYRIKDLSLTDTSQKLQMTLKEVIETVDSMKVDAVLQKSCKSHRNCLNDLCSVVEEVETGEKAPVILVMSGKQGSHAVLAYKIEENEMFVYDPDFPEEERIVKLKKASDGAYTTWSYKIKDNYEWGSAFGACSISFIMYEDCKEIWAQRTQRSDNQMNLVTLSTKNAVFYNENNEVVATLTDGVLNSNQENIFLLQEVSLGNIKKDISVYLPVDTYTVENLDSSNGAFSVSIVDVNQGASITTASSKVTFTINDQKKINRISCNAAEGQTFHAVLESSVSDDKKYVEVTGTGTPSKESGICQSEGSISLLDGNISSITVDGQEKEICEISSRSSAGGTVLVQGAQVPSASQNVLFGEKATYIIQPEEGYILADVLVDGQSQGPVFTYTFENVTTTHNIVAVFTKFDSDFVTIDTVETKWHTGKEVTPDVKVCIGDTVLKKNVDYYLAYMNNVAPGTATIFILGAGNYKSLSKATTFQIVPAKKEEYTVNDVKYQIKSISAQTKEGTVAIVGYKKSNKSISVKNKIKIGNCTFHVTEIKKNAFKNCSQLKSSINIGSAMSTIGDNAFYGCKTLKKVKFGKHVKNIGKSAFYKCANLSRVTFTSNKINKIGKNAFKNNKKGRIFYYPKSKKNYFIKLLKNQ